jgi:hypothetical protein
MLKEILAILSSLSDDSRTFQLCFNVNVTLWNFIQKEMDF